MHMHNKVQRQRASKSCALPREYYDCYNYVNNWGGNVLFGR